MNKPEIEITWRTPIRVESLKLESGMSDVDFEVNFGISPIMLEAAANGRDTIKESHIEMLARYFGLTVGQVCGAESL